MNTRLIPPVILLILLSACGSASADTIPTTVPTDTAVPPPATSTPEPTQTEKPSPTDTPVPTPTASITPTPEPKIKSEQVQVTYEDKVIRGTLVGEGDIAVVLAPMFGEPRGSWIDFAKYIASLGYTALAFDFPGTGTSSGNFSFDGTTFDALAVIGYLREQGFERIVCMGGSLGGGACFEAAKIDLNLAGLVILSSPFNTTAEEVSELVMPKLLVVGNEPSDVTGPMRETFKLLPDPKQFETIPQKAHGTQLLTAGDELRDLLVEFLENIQ